MKPVVLDEIGFNQWLLTINMYYVVSRQPVFSWSKSLTKVYVRTIYAFTSTGLSTQLNLSTQSIWFEVFIGTSQKIIEM